MATLLSIVGRCVSQLVELADSLRNWIWLFTAAGSEAVSFKPEETKAADAEDVKLLSDRLCNTEKSIADKNHLP